MNPNKIRVFESEIRTIIQNQLDKRIPFYDQIIIFLQQIRHTFIEKKPGVTKEFDLLYEILSKAFENWDKLRASIQASPEMEFVTLAKERTEQQIKDRTENLQQPGEKEKDSISIKSINTSVSFYDPYLIGSIFTINPSSPPSGSSEKKS